MRIMLALLAVALLGAAAAAQTPAGQEPAVGPGSSAATPVLLSLVSAESDVLLIQGTPDAKRTLGDAEIWFYGQSQVYLRAGKVWHWLVVDRPLRVEGYPAPALAAHSSPPRIVASGPPPVVLPSDQYQAMTQIQAADFWRRQSALPGAAPSSARTVLQIQSGWKRAESTRLSVESEVARRSAEIQTAFWKAENHRRVVENELRRRTHAKGTLGGF